MRDPAIGGFDQVNVLQDKEASLARSAIATFFHRKRKTDLLLLYFSGHGLLDEEGILYLTTPDTNKELPDAQSVPAQFVNRTMKRSTSRRKLLILDCCHSGASQRGSKSALGQKVGTGHIFDGDGQIILTASDATEYAFEGNEILGAGHGSVFTHYLVQGLKSGKADIDNDGQVTVDEWYRYTYEQVIKRIEKQKPMIWTYGGKGILVIAQNPTYTPPEQASPPATITTPHSKRWTVKQRGHGDFKTITQAIQVAQDGDTIEIHPGMYKEQITLTKSLELVGIGDPDEIIIRTIGKDTLRFQSEHGHIHNLTLWQRSKGNHVAVRIEQGYLRLENCIVRAEGRSAIAVDDDAYAIIRDNQLKVHNEPAIVGSEDNLSKDSNEIVCHTPNILLPPKPNVVVSQPAPKTPIEDFTVQLQNKPHTQELYQQMTNGDLPPIKRYQAGVKLDELGWLPPDLNTWIRCEQCANGGRDLLVMKYPLTNVQFAPFIQASGYDNLAYWGGEKSEGWQYRQKESWQAPCYWNHADFGQHKQGFPIVGISWYEATAYAHWLTALLKQNAPNPLLADLSHHHAMQVRLPTEQEWVRLAGGKQNNRYTWDKLHQTTTDKKEIVKRANVSESSIDKTTPVAMYLQGTSHPFGLQDVTGNVWEWTTSLYDEKQWSDRFVLRGGAWNLNHSYARVSNCYWNYPLYRNFSIGVRLVSPIRSGS